MEIKERSVYFDHDGPPEDTTCLMLLLGMKHIDLIGITVTQGDCFGPPALEMTLKVLSLYERNIDVVLGEYISPTQFPIAYKYASSQINNLPLVINQHMNLNLVSKLPAGEFMAKKIKSCPRPVTVLAVGPLSHVAMALEYDPSIISNIEEIIIMGGAIDVAGNIYNEDGSIEQAEWNLYWDIQSAQKVLESKIPMTIFPLDATNQVKLEKWHLKEISKYSNYNILEMVGQFYAICYNAEFIHTDNYYFWDSLCTSSLGCEGMAEYETIELSIIPKGAKNEGKTFRNPGCGNWVQYPKKVDAKKFFNFFIETLKKNGKLTSN